MVDQPGIAEFELVHADRRQFRSADPAAGKAHQKDGPVPIPCSVSSQVATSIRICPVSKGSFRWGPGMTPLVLRIPRSTAPTSGWRVEAGELDLEVGERRA